MDRLFVLMYFEYNMILTSFQSILHRSASVLQCTFIFDLRVFKTVYRITPASFKFDILYFQCLEVLYGGNVFLNHDNIIPFLKFGIKFQIDELVNICCVWLQENGLYEDLGLLLNTDIDKRLKLLDKLIPRVRQHSAGSAASSLSSNSDCPDYDPPSSSPDPPSSSPDPTFNSSETNFFAPSSLNRSEEPVRGEERWSRAPRVRTRCLSGCPKVSGDICLDPRRSRMRSDDEKEWKPSYQRVTRRYDQKFVFHNHDHNREKDGVIPDPIPLLS